jgi:hypothetical protein
MDQQLGNVSPLDLPKPSPEQPPASLSEINDASPVVEKQQAQQMEQPGSVPAPVVASPAGAVPAVNPLTAHEPPAAQVGAVNGPANTAAMLADDTDLIEKEWVIKAKAIVDQTRLDPYQQNKAINRVKADYLKQRYQKDLKQADE